MSALDFRRDIRHLTSAMMKKPLKSKVAKGHAASNATSATATTVESLAKSQRGSANSRPLVGIIMGSSSDWETMEHAVITLTDLGVSHETRVVSAHRTPDLLF